MNNITSHFKSRLLLFFVTFLLAFNTSNTKAQVITTLPLANLNICACSQINVSYSATGVYSAGNVFTVQLSDAAGNFVAPTNIGSLASVALNGVISCTIPCNTPYGVGYRIRIVSSMPVAGGPNNGVDILIQPSPTVTINFSTASCVDTLTAVPSGGGAGVVSGDKYYITDIVPWGSPNNVAEMNTVFGVGNWIQASFSVNAATVFVPGTQFVFLEGSDQNGISCTNFVNANIALIESWVNAGGRLFLNAAPNNGAQQNWGFGGVVLNYQNLIPNPGNNVPGVLMTNMTHPINLGPYLPTDPGGVYTGNYYAHANVQNGGTTLMHNAANANEAVLTEMSWGAGLILFGGMTTSNWHNTVGGLVNQHAVNLRQNMLVYISGAGVPAPPTYTYLWSTGDTTPKILPSATGIYTVTVTTNFGCTATATYNYVAPVPPPVNITSTGTLCSGNTITLDAGAGFASYLWDDASTSQTRIITTAGTYYVTVTNAQGCEGSDTIVVPQDTSVVADFTAVLHLGCENDTVFLTNNSTGATQFNWLFGDGGYSTFQNPVPYVYFTQGSYNIRLVVFNPPCSDTMIIPITINHTLTADFTTAIQDAGGFPSGNTIDSTCFTTPPDKVLVTALDGQAQLTHRWIWGDGSPDGNLPAMPHTYQTPGTFVIYHIVTDTLGCVDTATHLIYVAPPTFLYLWASDSSVCVGEKVTFRDSMSFYAKSFTYDFGDGSVLSNTHNPTHSWDAPSTYIVTVKTNYQFCPSDSITKAIEVSGYPVVNIGKDTSICPGVTGSILIADVNNPGAVYNWSTGENASSIIVTQPGIYWATSSGECSTTDSIRITRDCYLNIPNAFSPDGDGLNDYFLPRELLSSGLKSFKMDIYNRWGENIFTTTSIEGRGWDGKYNGVPQPMSTYVYVIDAEFNNNLKKNFKGNVTLIR